MTDTPKGTQHSIWGQHYKIGANNRVFRHGLGGWVSSTTTADELMRMVRKGAGYER